MINVNSKFNININDRAKVLCVGGINEETYEMWKSGKELWYNPLELFYISMIGAEVIICEIEFYKVGDKDIFWYKARREDYWIESRFEQSELEIINAPNNENVVIDNKFDIGQKVEIDFTDVFDYRFIGSGTVIGLKAFIRESSVKIEYLVSIDGKIDYKVYFPDNGLKNKA